MYLVVVDLNGMAHFIDHKTKYDCITICGDDVKIIKNNFLSFDNDIPHLCNACKNYQNLIMGTTNHPLARSISQQNILIKAELKRDTQFAGDMKHKPVYDKHWKMLIKFKHYSQRHHFLYEKK